MATRKYIIDDKLVVVALTVLEATSLYSRLLQHTGIMKSKKLITAEGKLKSAIDGHLYAKKKG